MEINPDIDNETIVQAVIWLQNQYDNKPDVFTFQSTIGGVTFAIKSFPDKVYIFFEGTHNAPDVRADFEAAIVYPKELNGGGAHSGFWNGLIEAFAIILPYLSKNLPIYLCGHSLGAGRVNLATALLLHYGYSISNLFRIKFGCPNSNDLELENQVSASKCVSIWNYSDVFFHDPVGSVPLYCAIKGYGFPYFTGEKRTLFNWPPGQFDKWGPIIGYHHLTPNYYGGVKNLC